MTYDLANCLHLLWTGASTIVLVATGAQETTIISPGYRDPYGWQSSIGFQKQLGSLMAFDVDFTSLAERNMVRVLDVIAGYDPKDELTVFSVGRLPASPYASLAGEKT